MMQVTTKLEEFLRGKAPSPSEAVLLLQKWAEQRDMYLRNVERLLANIKMWLRPLKEERLVSIIEGKTTIIEENLQSYDAPELTIFLSSQPVTIKPVGTNVFGVFGRVDIIAPFGTASIVLTEPGNWRFVRREYIGSGQSSAFYTDVNEAEFKNFLFRLISA